MLRLGPTAIGLDARDIERHVANAEKRVENQQANQGKKRSISFNPFMYQLNIRRTRASNDSAKGPLITDELLRRSVMPSLREDPVNNSLDEMTNETQAKGKGKALDYEEEEVYLSTDGQVESRPNSPSQFSDTSETNQTIILHSRRVSNAVSTITEDIANLSMRMDALDASVRKVSQQDEYSQGTTISHAAVQQDLTSQASEPRLPSLPRSPMADTHSSGSAGAVRRSQMLHASPVSAGQSSGVMNASHSSPANQTGGNQEHFAGIARDVRFAQQSRSSPVRQTLQPDLEAVQARERARQSAAARAAFSYSPLAARVGLPASLTDFGPSDTGAITTEQRTALNHGSPTPRRRRHPSRDSNFHIYDDSIPPELQPQTPVGLPRHGLPNPRAAVPWTAPQAQRSNLHGIPPPTPSMGRLYANIREVELRRTPRMEHAQENTTSYPDWEERMEALHRGQ